MIYRIFDYLEQLDLHYSDGNDKLIFKELRKYYSKQRSEKILQKFYSYSNLPDNSKLYSFKNKEYNQSMILSAAWDFNIYASIGKWIEENKTLFGKTILDIGCDNGILTCFIALMFPNSHIVGIDSVEESVAIAKQLAEKLELRNIEFHTSSLENYKQRIFETIIESRVLHENIDTSISNTIFMNFDEKVNYWKAQTEKIAKDTIALLDVKGNFISINRTDKNAYFLSWLFNLNESGLNIIWDTTSEITIKEPVGEQNFQFVVANKVSDNVDQKETKLWYIRQKSSAMAEPECRGDDADLKLSICSKEVIAGYKFYDKSGHLKCQYSLHFSSCDNTAIYLYLKSLVHNLHYLQTYDISEQQNGINEVENTKNNLIRKGYKCENLLNNN